LRCGHPKDVSIYKVGTITTSKWLQSLRLSI
jgi:hypothetical protein